MYFTISNTVRENKKNAAETNKNAVDIFGIRTVIFLNLWVYFILVLTFWGKKPANKRVQCVFFDHSFSAIFRRCFSVSLVHRTSNAHKKMCIMVSLPCIRSRKDDKQIFSTWSEIVESRSLSHSANTEISH